MAAVAATIQLPDGEIIGHKILDWESSRAAAAAARAGHKNMAVGCFCWDLWSH